MNKKIAIIELGGKQHLVHEGAKVVVNKISQEIGKIISLTNILNNEPVSVKLTAHLQGPKISGLKFKAKTRYFKRYGHRQQLSSVEVISIGEVAVKTRSESKQSVKTPTKKTDSANTKKKSTAVSKPAKSKKVEKFDE